MLSSHVSLTSTRMYIRVDHSKLNAGFRLQNDLISNPDKQSLPWCVPAYQLDIFNFLTLEVP